MIIEMPDGARVTFPDDMSRDKIKGMIAKKYPDFAKQFQPKKTSDNGMDFISKEGEEAIAEEFGDDKTISKLSGLDAMSDSGLNVGTMSKLDAMLSFAKLAANKDKRLEFIKPAVSTVEAFKNTDYSELGSEALKSVGRQTTSLLVGGTGFYVKNAGRLLHSDDVTAEDFNTEFAKTSPFFRVWKATQAVSDTMVKFGDSLEDLEKKVNDSDILRAEEGLFEGDWEENPNLHKVVDLAMSGVSSLAGMYTIGKVTNPAVGLYFMSGVDAKDVFEESLEAGNSKLKSLSLWGAATAGTAKLEKFGFEKVFNVKITSKGMQAIVDSSKKTSEKILEGVLSEGAEEGLQTVWQNTIAKIGYDETRDIFQNAVESAIGGALGGGLVSSFNFGIQSFNKKAKKAGLNEQEQTNILNNVAQSIADNPDLVDVPFQENMKKTYDSFSKMIAEMKDSPEKQRLIATKEALDTGYQKYYDEFKSYMSEEQAKANASLLRSSALFFSDLDGITVDEWFETRAPQIKRFGDVSKQAKEFVDNVTPTKLTLDEEEVNLFEALKNPELIKQYQEKDTRESLLRFIKKQGGAKDVGGDLKAMDLGKQVIGVINNKSGNSLDDLALSAWERGYFPEFTERPTVNDLLDAMREESFGKKRYAGEKKQGIEDYVNTLAENLNRMGIDYKDMTPAEIEQVYNQRMAEVQENIQPDTTPTESFAFADNEFFQVADENAKLDDIYPAYEGETININGQEKTVYNSNGDRIAKSKEALENFYKWFGDSKVVDEQGRPLVVYHGTYAEFDTFNKNMVSNYSAYSKNFYFTENKQRATDYGNKILSVYLKSDNLFDVELNLPTREDIEKINTILAKDGLKLEGDYGFDGMYMTGENFLNDLGVMTEQDYDYLLKEIGYDGIKSKDEFIVFEPNQIKSTSNRGTYSESENIYYQGAQSPADVKVIQKFYQNEQAPLGAYVNRVIYLNETANASTLPHELAHFWSDELKRSKSLRAKEILRQADIWENKEFDRKYSIAETENGFVVTDKAGKTVYDRMGEGFRTKEQAKAYAKEELFARGFEKYIKEGKAPSKTLRVAFANFYNWLKKIYSDLTSLDIKLSKPMRDMYANILGSTNIDVFLDSDADNFIAQREQAEEQKEKVVQKIIDNAPVDKSLTLPEKIRKAYEEFDFGESWKKIMIPLSTRAKRVAPTLRNKIRRFEFDVLETKQNYYRETEPMMRKWNKFSKEDAVAFDLALKNGAVEIRDKILRKYDAIADFEKVKAVLEDIYYKANDAGLDVGYIEDYFPRKIIDKDGLMSYLHGTDEWSSYQQALQREDPHGQFSAEEQAEFLDKFLRGVVRADVAAYKYSSEKARKLDIIDNTLNQYYADSMQALISYIDGMNARISTVNFFGRNRENVDESIGEFVAYLLNNNQIKPSQVDEVKSILNAVFKRAGVRQKWIKGLRDMAYIYTMGGVNTAITQIDDIFVAAYKGGVLNTIQSAFSKDRVTKKDLGLDSIAAEFMNSSGTSKVVNWVFTHNGIELIDSFGKNSLLNGVLKKMEKMSDEELREYIAPIMEDETEQTIKEVRNGELSANVRFFLFNEISDMQPVSLSELPEIYNVGGNARIFYMLKSFMLKRIDTIRNECYDKIRSNNKAERVEGWQNLYRLVLLMMIGGATKDLLIDLMYNRVIDLNDTIVNNLLGMIGISKYNIYQVREEGFGHTISIFVTPPLLQVADDLAGDVNKYIQGKRQIKDFEVFKGLPIIGRFYYWLAGGGKAKMERKKKKKG